MRLLILGGTVFLGRWLAEAALVRGHVVTLFNRGRHNPDLFPEAERLRGDRDGDLEALRGRVWDAAIDTCAYVPRIARRSAELLAPAVDRLVFISSVSVYRDFEEEGIDESYPVGRLEDAAIEKVTGDTYGPLKALCEEAVEAALPGRTLVVRPGLIVGPHDPTDRFTWWPARIARGGPFLAPAGPDWTTQFIDVRDLAGWVLDLLEAGVCGVYNATGPREPLPFGTLVRACQDAAGTDAEPVWVPEAFLLEQGVQPWMELPLWVPASEGPGFSRVSVAKALAAGLNPRPVAETVADTLAWAASRPEDHAWRAGLAPDREARVLQQWRAAARPQP